VVMDESSIQRYVKSSQSDIKESPQMGEATTKASLLHDFVDLLGWEIPTNTELEYPVKAFGSTYKVDYALVLDGRPVAFLEAKGLDTPLNTDFRGKFGDYLRGENVNWGILTNGQEYEFYQRRVVNSKVNVDLIEQTTLDQLPNKIKIIEAYQPEKIREEESEVIIEHIRKLREAWQTLGNDKDELATAVADTLTDSVPDAIEPEAELQAKEMIDRLIADIESEVDTDATSNLDERSVS
jgi:predicted type IV restriction endonuclease